MTTNPMMVGTSYATYPIPKYVVSGGYVISQNDGQRHWVSADRVIDLYGVNPRKCVIASMNNPYLISNGQIPLSPRYDGDYTTIPKPYWDSPYPIPITINPATIKVTFDLIKPQRVRNNSPTFLYKCGNCGYEKKITNKGMTRHWRKCVRNDDGG